MSRPFPRLVLKVERGSLSHRKTTWLHFHISTDMRKTARDLIMTVPDIVRITSICVYPDGRAIKITSYTPGEHPWHFAHWTAQQCKFKSLRSLGAAFAILPKEVLDEATR